MKALTDAELATLILKAVEAERAACAALCLHLGERTKTIRERATALACFAAIRARDGIGVDGVVNSADTRPS